MLPKTIRLTITGVFIVSLLVTFGFLSILSWVVVGVLCSVVIGIFSWLISLTSKTKDPEKPIERGVAKEKTAIKKLMLDKEIVLEGESYEIFPVDLKRGDHLLGEVSSEDAINVFLVTKSGLRKFENEEDFSYEDCGGGEGIKRTRIDFTPPKSGRWFLVVENEADEDANVEIRLFVASR
jgi:hypothetical protein